MNAPQWISQFSREHLASDVHVEKVRTNFLGSFYFEQVDIEKPVLIKIPEITLSLRPLLRFVLTSESADWGKVQIDWRPYPSLQHNWAAKFSIQGIKSEIVLAQLKEKAEKL